MDEDEEDVCFDVEVFICHAEEQEKDFVDTLGTLLKDVHKLSVTLDEQSLLVGSC